MLAGLAAAPACGGPLDAPAEPAERPPTAGPAPEAERSDGEPTALRPTSGLLLGAPVYDGDFADPYVLRLGDTFYAYATNTTEANLPVIVAKGTPVARYYGDAFPSLPDWSEPGFVWAPTVAEIDDDFVVYYSTRVRGTTMQCISRAVASDPLGPFVDDSSEPMVCQSDLGGSIDPSVVTDESGTRWLLFKNDGSCCGLPTSIWSQQLAPDGLSTLGEPIQLMGADQGWEGGLVEGPSMIRDGDRYYLFYSANAWDSEDYGVGYAVCDSVAGPCRKAAGGSPWMGSTTFARGPGGQEFFQALGETWMVYHGWAEGEVGSPGSQRRLFLDIVDVVDGVPQRVGRPRTWAFFLGLAAVVVTLLGAGCWWWRRRRRRRDEPAPDSETQQAL